MEGTDTIQPRRTVSDAAELHRWQSRLLPFVTASLVALTLAFFAIVLVDIRDTRTALSEQANHQASDRIDAYLQGEQVRTGQSSPSDSISRALLLLEAHAIDKRYSQANALLMSRVWTRQFSFLTGMVLAFIGSIFILSKLSEGQTDVSVAHRDWKSGITSSSPGLVLAFFGTALIVVSLMVQPKIEVQDRAIYLQTGARAATEHTPNAAPQAPYDPFVDEPAAQHDGGKADEAHATPR